MKFEQYPIKYDKSGFGFAKPDIMVGDTEKKCFMCGTPTRYIEILSEGHFCSDECVNKFYEELDKRLYKFYKELPVRTEMKG